MASSPHVFISYKRVDQVKAFELKHSIEKAGFAVWIDQEGIRSGKDWREEIDQAIEEAFALILIISSAAIKEPKYMIYEFAYAIARKIEVIPVMLDLNSHDDFHPRLVGRHAIAFANTVRLVSDLNSISQEYSSKKVIVPITGSSALREAVKRLDSTNSDERMQALNSIAEMNDPSRLDVLVSALQHPYADVQIQAASRLSSLQDIRALPTLIKFRYDDRRDPAMLAQKGLESLGEKALPELRTMLSHRNPEQRRRAALTLGTFGVRSRRSIEPLKAVIGNRNEIPEVRYAAAQSLGEIGGNEAIDTLLPYLDDDDSKIRALVVEVLGETFDARYVPKLVEQYHRDPSDNVRGESRIALSRIAYENTKNRDVILTIVSFLSDESLDVRTWAANVIADLGNPIVVPVLAEILKCGDPDLQVIVVEVLRRVHAGSAIPYLIEALNDSEQKVRVAAYNALNVFDTPEAKAAIEKYEAQHKKVDP